MSLPSLAMWEACGETVGAPGRLWMHPAPAGTSRQPQAKRAHRRRYGEAAKGYLLGLSLFSARIMPITLNLKLGHCGLLTRPVPY
jgi:hypothetical protein